jgi:serine/threonine protein kinase
MADLDIGSFQTVPDESELLHRPVQSFAVRGQASFLGLCVRLQVPVLSGVRNISSIWGLAPSGAGASSFVAGSVGDGWEIDTGLSLANTFTSSWFRKWLPDGRGKLQVRHVCKRVQVSPDSGSSDNDDSKNLASIANEVRILSNHSIRSSANIVSLIAVSWCEAPHTLSDRFWPQLLLEQAEFGTLDACLSRDKIAKATKFMLYRDVLDGLRYLHANGVAHGDLKPQNVLLSYDATFEGAILADERYGMLPLKAKLCDFGFSVILSDYHPSLPFRAQMGTWPWSAPELDGVASIPASLLPSTDVYSAGLLMVSIIRDGKMPFDNMSRTAGSTVKKKPHLALNSLFGELCLSYALGAPHGLSCEQLRRVFGLVINTIASIPEDRVGIDGFILAWDEVLRLAIAENRRWRGTSYSVEQ